VSPFHGGYVKIVRIFVSSDLFKLVVVAMCKLNEETCLMTSAGSIGIVTLVVFDVVSLNERKRMKFQLTNAL
jgi:hypothetical protein